MPGLLQLRIACLPGGSVRRKQPQLHHVSYFMHISGSEGEEESTYLGDFDGAHTMAMDSGIMT